MTTPHPLTGNHSTGLLEPERMAAGDDPFGGPVDAAPAAYPPPPEGFMPTAEEEVTDTSDAAVDLHQQPSDDPYQPHDAPATSANDFRQIMDHLLEQQQETQARLRDITTRLNRLGEQTTRIGTAVQSVGTAVPGTGVHPDSAIEPSTATAITRRHQPKQAARPAWRWLKRGLALVILLLLGLSIILPYALPISGDAVVNAHLAWVQAPIQGHVRPAHLEAGTRLSVGQSLGEIVNPRVDTSRLQDLHNRRANLASHRASLASEIDEQEQRRTVLANAIMRLKESLLADLDRDLAEHALLLSEQRQVVADYDEQMQRFHSANEHGAEEDIAVITRDQIDNLQRDRNAAEMKLQRLEITQERLQQKRLLIEAERFIDMDRPLEFIRFEEASNRIAALRRQIDDLDMRITDVDNRIRNEDERLERLRQADLAAPVTGPLWQVKAGVDTFVGLGDRLLAIADESTVAVEAYLHQRYLDQVSVGDRVLVHLLGAETTLTGTIRHVHIRDQQRDADEFAYQLSLHDETHFKIVVELAGPQRASTLIGQRAQVLVTGDRPGWFKRLILQTYTTIGF